MQVMGLCLLFSHRTITLESLLNRIEQILVSKRSEGWFQLFDFSS
jgi:hypothetical protein